MHHKSQSQEVKTAPQLLWRLLEVLVPLEHALNNFM